MLQAWDFVPGTNFIDFMDRGVSEASVVVSVLSRNYLTSRYGRLEWQAALRADPDDVNRLVTIRVEDCPLEGHTGRLWTAAIDPTGTTIATAGDDLVVRLWDAGTGEHLHALDGHTRRVWSVAFSPDGSQLASAGDDGTVRIWSLASDSAPRTRMTLLGLAEGWAALAPDGRYKLAGTVAGEFWHVVGTCRFEPGEIDLYLPAIRQLPMGAEF